jgi:glycosyltransferase involved in cell wall biosynthesis
MRWEARTAAGFNFYHLKLHQCARCYLMLSKREKMNREYSRKIRVLHVITTLDTGGAEMMLYKLLAGLKGTGIESRVVCLGDLGTIGPRIQKEGVTVHALECMGPGLLSAPWRLMRALRGFRPQVVQGWMYHGNFVATLIASLSGGRLLWNIRQSFSGYRDEKPLTALMIWLGARLSGRPERVIYNSETSRAQHEDIGYRRHLGMFIPNGFFMNRFVPRWVKPASIPGDGFGKFVFRVGLVGRDHPMKDIPNFIAAARLFSWKCPEARFICIGKGLDPGNERLTGILAQHGVAEKFLLLGERPDVADLVPVFDIFCLSSSRGDAFPNVVGEAMACGVPCVVTDVGDAARIVSDTGLVVPARDPDALAEAFGRLHALGPEGRRALGENARQRIESRYALDQVVHQYERLYAVEKSSEA